MAVLALCAALASPAYAQRTTYTGQWQCDDRGAETPLAGMNVELWKRGWDWLPVEISGGRVARGYTGSDGRFRLTSPPDDDNYFVRMALRDAHGVHLKDFWGINDWSVDSVQTRNDRATRNLGGLLLSTPGQSHKCAIWAGVHSAYEEYRAEVGSPLPSRGVEIQADAVTAGVPFTPHTSIWWPGGFEVGYDGAGDDSITRHEFGHVIRHGFDGDLGHFLGDVVDHNYLQTHEVCNHTGFGFAFNEGWAEYWARDFAPAPDCGRPGDMETEGNVAAALTELEAACAGNQRRLMVEVLRNNPGRIHSFEQFRVALGCPVPPPLPPPPPASGPPAPVAIPISDAKRAALAQGDEAGTLKGIRVLRRKLRVAVHRAALPVRCVKTCLGALKRETRPAGLRLQLALAKIHKSSVDDFDSVREQRRLRNLAPSKLVRRIEKKEASDRRKAIEAALTATKRVLAAARPVLRLDGSKRARRFRKDMTKTAARLRRAAKGKNAVLPPSLTIPPGKIRLPRRVRPIPEQAPPPPPDRRVTTTLTLDSCPANVAAPKPIEVAGKLTPAQAGIELKVTFTHASAGSEVKLVKSDANGNWTAEHEPSPNATGDWSVVATFAGDANRKPSISQACTSKYE
jgi:hypothetical protein